ncbi:MAG TPA: prolyl oligopeptidase family serine peptidase [Thermoanaerobaculia bacterium]|nr:prolyl oligopeptidase family serine peptidase [Thermoanaerobaculia bacterium]
MPDGWVLDRVAGLVESQGEVIVSAFRRAPLGAATRQLLALPLSGAREPRVLADGSGWSSAEVAEATGYWVHSRSTATEPTRRTLRHLDGSEVAKLPADAELAPELAALPAPAFLEIETAGGARLPAQIVYPAGFDPSRKYPVVMFHYGGPASQVVVDRWGGGRGLWLRWMASRGYVALAVDNEASVFFGKAGEDRLHRRFGELELAGQKAAVAWLAERGWADTSRVGLWGWSGGGTHTLYALFHSPGTWRAGVAGAPVTDWRLYDSIYTERYFGTPADNPDGYRDSSPLTAAGNLADALLVVHGTADDNVHPQNTVQLVDALVEAGKPVEMMLYPGHSHGVRGAANRDFYRRMTGFFDRHLRAAEPATQP